MSGKGFDMPDEGHPITIMFYCYNAIKCFLGHLAYIFSIKLIHKSCIKCIKSKSNSFDLRVAAAVVLWYTAYYISSTLKYIKCASIYSKYANPLDKWLCTLKKKGRNNSEFFIWNYKYFSDIVTNPENFVHFH